MDENKENQTPEVVQQQGELDWVQQYSLDQEREEQELQQALAQSLQEHVRLDFFHFFFNSLFAIFFFSSVHCICRCTMQISTMWTKKTFLLFFLIVARQCREVFMLVKYGSIAEGTIRWICVLEIQALILSFLLSFFSSFLPSSAPALYYSNFFWL